MNETSVGEIHSMYQDLFLTDMKREVEDAQSELKQCKQESNTTNREINILRKEQAQLQATLKRYRKMVQEMSAEHYQGGKKRDQEFQGKSGKSNAHKKMATRIGGKGDMLTSEYTLADGPHRAFTQADPLKIKTHNR